MSRAQRVVLIVYCLAVVYCCIWIPWHYDSIRVGYGLLWTGPSRMGDRSALAAPDLSLIFLRILAATAASATAYLTARRN